MATTLKAELRKELDQARKGRDKIRTVVLSSALSDLRNWEIEEGREAGDESVRQVLARAVKQRKESAEQMRSGGRPELAEREDREAEILQSFLPPPLTEADVRALVQEAVSEGLEQPGPIMGRIMPQLRGRFDGKEANRIVMEELSS